MAETFTDKLKLTKRETGDLDWGAGHNANLDLLDAHVQRETLRPPRTLQASLGSGGVGSELLGNTVYFFKVTAFNASGETTENKIPSILEALISQPTTPVPVILQWEVVKGASGYRIYKSTVTGQEQLLAEVTGESTVTYTDMGNTAVNNLISVPSQNTARASVKKIIAGSGISVSPTDGTGDVTIQSNVTGGVTTLRKTGNPTGLSSDVSLEEGSGISLSQDDPNKKITVANAGVTGVRKLGDATPLTGDVKLEAGTNISLTQDAPNNKVVIAATAGGVTSLKKTGSGTSLVGDVSLEQGTGIALTQDDANSKINVANTGVTGVRKLGDASPLTGDVKLEAGTNITLTTDTPNNKITIAAAAGGGASGYATQIVAAPTGVAATDTANIQNALNAAGTAGGGIVMLREGTYNINATLSIPAKVTLAGQGRSATTILGDPTFGASNMISAGNANVGLRDLTVDENYPNRTANSGYTVMLNGSKPLVENVQIVRNRATNAMLYLGDGQMRNCIITNNGNGLGTAVVQGGTLIEQCEITVAQNNGNVNDILQQPSQVVNCRLIRSFGSMSGNGIRFSSSNGQAVGNGIYVGSGNKAITLGSGSTAHVVVGNICNGATILLELNVNSSIVVGNASVVVTNNSGTGTNQIANNS